MNNTRTFFIAITASVALASWLEAGATTENDVGDPDSFKQPANFLGVGSGFIYVNNCPAASPTPVPSPAPNNNSPQCFTTVACPGTDSFDAMNIATVVLPKDATRDIIYPVLNFFHDFTLENTSGSPQNSV